MVVVGLALGLVGMFRNGEEIAAPDEQGQPVVDDSFLLLFNGSHDPVPFTLPPSRYGRRWAVELRTDEGTGDGADAADAGEVVTVAPLSLTLLRRED